MRYFAMVLMMGGMLAGCGSASSSNSTSGPGAATSGSTTVSTVSPTTASGQDATTSITASTRTSTPPKRRQPPKPHPPKHECVGTGGYKGLYSTVSAFRSDHSMTAPSAPIDGIDWNTITSTEHGCVTGYSVDEFASPPLGAADIMFLTDGINLPDDKTDVLDKDNCTVYSSAILTRASGFKFAVVTATAQDGHGAPAHAEIHLTNDGNCPS